MNASVISGFYYEAARYINKQRIKHLETLNLDFNNKSVLETGCGGVGDITNFLLSKNANITLNDFRKENIEGLLYNIGKDLPYNTLDLNEIIDIEPKFDIIVSYGTLYHLTKLNNAIKNFANLCNEFVIISTCTSGRNDENINFVLETPGNEQTSHLYGSRPGRIYIWNELNKNFKYVYMTKTQPDHEDFPLCFPSNHHASRCIFIGSHIELNNNNLVDYFINNYTL